MKKEREKEHEKEKSGEENKIVEKKRILKPLIAVLLLSAILGLFIYLLFWKLLPTEPEDRLSDYIRRKEFVIFDENFHEEEKIDISYRWLSKNGTITLVIPYDQVIKLEFFSWSYNMPRSASVYLNDYLLTDLNLTKERTNYASPFVYLKKGVYELKFSIPEECQVPALVENSDDTRCLSIGIGDFKKLEVNNLATFIDTPGWHGLESYYGRDMRWIEKAGIIKLINFEEGDYFLEFFAFSFYFDRNLNVYVDEQLVHSSKITPDGSDLKIKIPLQLGLHAIKLDAGVCDYPLKLGISADPRCLSVAVVRPIIYR